MTNQTTSEHQNDVGTHNYALNGKIMLCSAILLFAALLVAFCLHSRRRTRRNLHGAAEASPGLDHSSAFHGGAVLKCAVCLSGFRNDEAGRVLPKCEHAFHARCIDAWLRSRSNCPLCRAPVQVHAIVVVREPVQKEAEPVNGKDEHGSVNV